MRIRAEAQRYDWVFGDGASAGDVGPGKQGTDAVSHTYLRSGSVAPYVRITWGGTFTIEGIDRTFTDPGHGDHAGPADAARRQDGQERARQPVGLRPSAGP